MTCPRCGRDFAAGVADELADAVVEHAQVEHRHDLERETVLAHLEGVHPHEREGSTRFGGAREADRRPGA